MYNAYFILLVVFRKVWIFIVLLSLRNLENLALLILGKERKINVLVTLIMVKIFIVLITTGKAINFIALRPVENVWVLIVLEKNIIFIAPVSL